MGHSIYLSTHTSMQAHIYWVYNSCSYSKGGFVYRMYLDLAKTKDLSSRFLDGLYNLERDNLYNFIGGN